MSSPISVKTLLPILAVLASCGSGDKQPLDPNPSVSSGDNLSDIGQDPSAPRYGYPIAAPRRFSQRDRDKDYNIYWYDFSAVAAAASEQNYRDAVLDFSREHTLFQRTLNEYASYVYNTIEMGQETSSDPDVLANHIAFHRNISRCDPTFEANIIATYECRHSENALDTGVSLHYEPLGGGRLITRLAKRFSDNSSTYRIGSFDGVEPGYGAYYTMSLGDGLFVNNTASIRTYTPNAGAYGDAGFTGDTSEYTSFNQATSIFRSATIALKGLRTNLYP